MPIDPIVREDALDFLKENKTAVIATSFEGQPHASIVYYQVDDDFNLYFITKRNTTKNIHTGFNSHVAFVVGNGNSRVTVQATGTSHVLLQEDKKRVVSRMQKMVAKEGVKRTPIEKMRELKDSPIVAYKIVPSELKFMNMDSKRYPYSISDTYHRIIE